MNLSILSSPKFYILFIVPFILWFLMFKGFILGDYQLKTDASTHYEIFQFYLENLANGTMPLWNPSDNAGVPFEFYMRRIGEFNPFYSLILIPYKLGFTFLNSYLAFLAIYYYLGMLGFFLTAYKLFNDEAAAYVSYLLLMFSSLSTLLWCSFIVLIFVPIMWFFYFLIGFLQDREKYQALGIAFCSMIIATTYIPFYFFTIFAVFVVLSVFIYPKLFVSAVHNSISFVGMNRWFSVICLLCVVLSCLPLIKFSIENSDKTKETASSFVTRNYNAPTASTLGVPEQRSDFGGIIPNLVIEELLSGGKNMVLSKIYVPFFAFIVVMFAFVVPITRRMAFIFLWGYILFMISIYDATPYKWLYEHVFYFKYFRNFQFFWWIAVLPLLCLLLGEQMRVCFQKWKQ